MKNIPSGNITFLFTDIEGSTKLAQQYPETLPFALEKHHLIMQNAIESNNGFLFEIVGDAFCAAFQNADDAVKAAYDAQIKLNSEKWNDAQIKVRMGIHSGNAEWSDSRYMGYITLARTQRVMSAAYGGQILLTQEVYDEIKDDKELNISFRDFGKRKLRDIIIPEHIYQIVSEELPSDFPPLKSQDARQNNLPSSMTVFIGRRKEIDELKKIFNKTRLLTLAGAGGTGKTRLAVQLASELIDEFENGVWIVELSPITNPDLIVKEISQVLNLKEDASRDISDTLIEFLKEKNLLLIFDNSEHLLTKCTPIAEKLLTNCHNLKIISTSREPFNIHGEIIYRVPPLSMPDRIKNETFESLSGYESVKLFLDRATSVNSKFKLTSENIYTVAELCKKLDGIPLAIELASKRVNVLSVEKIFERLDDRFKLLTGGSSTVLPRQKTLRALIDWSYDMLNFKEQLLLQRLSIFMGGWTLEAAEEICSDEEIEKYEILDLMNGLVDKSLIVFYEMNSSTRYKMLETIKFYSLEKLTEEINIFNKHLNYFTELSDYSLQKENGIEQYSWVELIASEIDNIRICVKRAIENNQEEVVKTVINMYQFWQNKGYFTEGNEIIMKVLNRFQIEDKKDKACLLEYIAQMSYLFGDFKKLETNANEALNLFTEINYKEGIISCLIVLGMKAYTALQFNDAVKLSEEALELSIEINSKEHKARSFNLLSSSLEALGFTERAFELKEEALKLYREIGDEHSVAHELIVLSVYEAKSRNNIQKATLLSEESLALSRKLDDQYFISLSLTVLGSLNLLYDKKDYSNAEYCLTEAYRISKTYGYNLNFFPLRIYLGFLYFSMDNINEAMKFYKEYISEREKPGADFFIKDVFNGFARIHLKKNEIEKAITLFGFVHFLSKGKTYKGLVKILKLSEVEKNELIEKLGEEKFNLYWNEGKAMNLDEAVDYTMKNDPPRRND